jgi:hypothetical protein
MYNGEKSRSRFLSKLLLAKHGRRRRFHLRPRSSRNLTRKPRHRSQGMPKGSGGRKLSPIILSMLHSPEGGIFQTTR